MNPSAAADEISQQLFYMYNINTKYIYIYIGTCVVFNFVVFRSTGDIVMDIFIIISVRDTSGTAISLLIYNF